MAAYRLEVRRRKLSIIFSRIKYQRNRPRLHPWQNRHDGVSELDAHRGFPWISVVMASRGAMQQTNIGASMSARNASIGTLAQRLLGRENSYIEQGGVGESHEVGGTKPSPSTLWVTLHYRDYRTTNKRASLFCGTSQKPIPPNSNKVCTCRLRNNQAPGARSFWGYARHAWINRTSEPYPPPVPSRGFVTYRATCTCMMEQKVLTSDK